MGFIANGLHLPTFMGTIKRCLLYIIEFWFATTRICRYYRTIDIDAGLHLPVLYKKLTKIILN